MTGAVLRDERQPFAEPVQLGEVLAGLPQGLGQHRGDGRRGVEPHLLVQETEVGGAGDTALVGFVDAGEYPQQGGLADAVLPDQADAPAGGGGQGDAVEDTTAAQTADEVAGEQSGLRHGNRPM